MKEKMTSFILEMVQQRFSGSDHNISAATTSCRKVQRYQHLCQYIMLNVIRQLTELIRAVEPFTGAVGEVRPIPQSPPTRHTASLVRTVINPNVRLPGFFVGAMRPFLQRLHSRLLLQRAYFLTVLSGCAALAGQYEDSPFLLAATTTTVPATTSGISHDDDRVRSLNEQTVKGSGDTTSIRQVSTLRSDCIRTNRLTLTNGDPERGSLGTDHATTDIMSLSNESSASDTTTAVSVVQATAIRRAATISFDSYHLACALIELCTVIGTTPSRQWPSTPNWVPILFEEANLSQSIQRCLVGENLHIIIVSINQLLGTVALSQPSFRPGTTDEIRAVMKVLWGIDCSRENAPNVPVHLQRQPGRRPLQLTMYNALIKGYLRAQTNTTRMQLFNVPSFDGPCGEVVLSRPLGNSNERYSRLSLTFRLSQPRDQALCYANAIADTIETDHRAKTHDFSIAAKVNQLASAICNFVHAPVRDLSVALNQVRDAAKGAMNFHVVSSLSSRHLSSFSQTPNYTDTIRRLDADPEGRPVGPVPPIGDGPSVSNV